MADTLQKRFARRVFLAAAASGVAALAGCSNTGGPATEPSTGRQSEATDEPTPKSPDGGDTDTEGTSDGDTETGTAVEDSEGEVEARYQESFERRDMSWIEIQDMENVEFPDSALTEGHTPEGNGIEGVFNYREVVDAIADRESRSNAEATNYIIGFRGLSEYEGSGEYDGQVRFFGSANKISGDWGLSEEGNAEEGAFRRFLQENVHGYVDHSEDIDEDLLAIARE